MPRYLSPEWAAAFEAALTGVTVPGPGDDAGLAAIGGTFTVVEEVRGVPDGDVAVVLRVDAGSLHLTVAPLAECASRISSDATISLSYEDATSLSKGALLASAALAAGKIRVRGDLSVLVASQQMLAAAQPYLAPLSAETTY